MQHPIYLLPLCRRSRTVVVCDGSVVLLLLLVTPAALLVLAALSARPRCHLQGQGLLRLVLVARRRPLHVVRPLGGRRPGSFLYRRPRGPRAATAPVTEAMVRSRALGQATLPTETSEPPADLALEELRPVGPPAPTRVGYAGRRPSRPRAPTLPPAKRIIRPHVLRPATNGAQGPETASSLVLADRSRRRPTGRWTFSRALTPPARPTAIWDRRVRSAPRDIEAAREREARPPSVDRSTMGRAAAHGRNQASSD